MTCCTSTSRWCDRCWSMPALCGTPASLPYRWRCWSRCSAKRCTLSFKMTTTSLIIAGLDTLESRRDHLTERFFKRTVLPETSSLYYLLPDKRDTSVTDRLHHATTFKRLKFSTVSTVSKFFYSILSQPSLLSLNLVIFCKCCDCSLRSSF